MPNVRVSKGWMAIGVAVVFVVGCGGSEGSQCRANTDCSGTLECAGPNDPQVCGIPAAEDCASDDACGVDMRCHARPDTCSPDGVGSSCDLPCVEGGCGEGFRCNAGGACEVVPCDEGEGCPSHETCDPSVAASGPVYNRAPGCVAIICSADGDCPAGAACVEGACHEGPGTCVEPQIVP